MLTPSLDARRNIAFEQSFDFSKLPNIQKVTLRFWLASRKRGLPWIPMSLSTLKPATSPRLSLIILDFISFISQTIEIMTIDMGHDLQRVADEVARIEREFEGAVYIAVSRDSRFKVLLDSLDVRVIFVGWGRPCGRVDSPSFFHCRSFSATFGEMRQLSPSSTAFGQSSCGIRSFNHTCRQAAHLDADFSYRALRCM